MLRDAQIPTGAAGKFAIVFVMFQDEPPTLKEPGPSKLMGSNGKTTSAIVKIL